MSLFASPNMMGAPGKRCNCNEKFTNKCKPTLKDPCLSISVAKNKFNNNFQQIS